MPGKMPPIGASVASGNRMSKMNAADMKAVKKTAMKKPAYKMGGCVRGNKNKAALYKAVKGK